MGIDHHLERGRALAAFNSLLALRLQNFNVQGSMIREHVGKFQRGQLHMSSELHAVLSPLSHEEKYLTNVSKSTFRFFYKFSCFTNEKKERMPNFV